MSGKRAVLGLIAALLAFGYVFTLNPGSVEFQIYPGSKVSTSLALVLFLFFLAGIGLATFATAFREAHRSFFFWRHRKEDQRRDEAKRLLVRGRGQAALGRTRIARKLMQRAYRKASGEGLVTLEMARVEIEDGELGAATQRLKNLLHEDPANPEVLSLLLEAYRRQGDREGQLSTLARRLEVDPHHLPSLRALRDLHRDAGSWSEAARAQERVLAHTEARQQRIAERRTLTELRFQQSRVLGHQEARKLLEQLIREDESFTPAHAALGDRLLQAEENEAAVQAWTRGYQVTGQEALLLKVEQLRLDEGRADDMLKLYKKLARKDGAALLLRARLLLTLERSQEVVELLEKDRSPQATTLTGRLLLGEALFRLRSCDEAVRVIREGFVASEDHLPFTFVCGHCGRATGQWQPACPSCDRFDTLALALEAVCPAPPPPPMAA